MPAELHFRKLSDGGGIMYSLPGVVADLRRRSGDYLLTTVAHGVRDQRLQLALQELHSLGVPESPARAPLALESTGLGYICIEARGARAGLPAPLPVLLVIAQAQALGLLLPAVQKVRDAASRMRLPAGSSILVGGGTPAAPGAPSSPGSHAWFMLRSTSAWQALAIER